MIECTLLVEKIFFKSYNMYINKKRAMWAHDSFRDYEYC